jgi:hypothetical protein
MSNSTSPHTIGGEVYLTGKELAIHVGFPYPQLWTRLARGTLPLADVNLGLKPLWKMSNVDVWLKEREEAKP